MNLNKVFVLGRLTRDPERKQLPSGQAVVSFGLATNRYYTTKEGEKREDVNFHNIAIFGRLAETAAQYLKKGSLALFEGRIQTRTWDDPSTGQKRYRTEIVAERMQLGPRSANAGFSSDSQEPSPAKAYNPSPPATTPVNPYKPQVKTAVSDEEIPVIEEDAPAPTPAPAPEPKQATKHANEPIAQSKAPTDNPFQKDDEQIDVKNIPF